MNTRKKYSCQGAVGFVVALLVLIGNEGASQVASRPRTPNGIYSIVREDSTEELARTLDVPHLTLIYDGKYVDSTQRQLPRYIAVDTSFFVPLILEGSPDAKKDGNGRTLLGVTLSSSCIKTLEDFTRAHLGGRVAIVLDGEVITMHKVRSIVSEGKLQITRCYDNACDVLRAKLAK